MSPARRIGYHHARRDIPAKAALTKGLKWWILRMFSVGTDASWNEIDAQSIPEVKRFT